MKNELLRIKYDKYNKRVMVILSNKFVASFIKQVLLESSSHMGMPGQRLTQMAPQLEFPETQKPPGT